MADVIYCHQCARDNAPARKFCIQCSSPLSLVENSGDQMRMCRNCHRANPSFAHFCTECSTPLIANPPKTPDSTLPVAFRNTDAIGIDGCPACRKPAPDLISEYVQSLEVHNRGSEIRDNVGFVYGTVGTRLRIDQALREPRAGGNFSKTMFTGTAGCMFAILTPALLVTLVPPLAFLVNSVVLLIIAIPIGFFLASQLYRRLLRPYLHRLELAKARWRQARICQRCDAVFIPKEGIYTSPAYLDRLVWNIPHDS